MESSNVGYQTCTVVIYILTTSIKGVSSMKLHRNLGITQKLASHVAHRLQKTLLKFVGEKVGKGATE